MTSVARGPAAVSSTKRHRVQGRADRRRRRAVWVTSFLAFTVLGSLWALASPLFSVADEPSHVIRAAAAARGQILPGERSEDAPNGTVVEVPRAYARSVRIPNCYQFEENVPAGCALPMGSSNESVEVETNAGLYPPAYYAVVGLPSLALTSETGVYLMRVLNAALCAALLASALTSAWLSRAPRLLVAGIAVAVTPEVLFLAGSVNPSGVETAAAVGLWVALAVALQGDHPEQRGRLLARAAVAGSVLAVTRPASPLWVALAVVTLVLWAGFGRTRELVRDRRSWLATAAVGLACASTVGWVLGYDPIAGQRGIPATRDGTFWDYVRFALGQTHLQVEQMIGWFGWLDTRVATLSFYLWLLAVGALVLLGLASSRLRAATTLVGLGVAVVVVPALVQAPSAQELGFPWQGRYTLPLAVGVPILAALQVDQARALPETLMRRLSLTLLTVFVVGQLYAHIWATRRYTVGVHGAINWISDARWDPPLPVWALLVAFGVALPATAAWLQRLTRMDRRTPSAGDVDPSSPVGPPEESPATSGSHRGRELADQGNGAQGPTASSSTIPTVIG